MARVVTLADCERFFNECKAYWIRQGDSPAVATSKAFWWDMVECFNFDNSWNDAKKEFAMKFRGYKVGNPVPSAEFVEGGAV